MKLIRHDFLEWVREQKLPCNVDAYIADRMEKKFIQDLKANYEENGWRGAFEDKLLKKAREICKQYGI